MREAPGGRGLTKWKSHPASTASRAILGPTAVLAVPRGRGAHAARRHRRRGDTAGGDPPVPRGRRHRSVRPRSVLNSHADVDHFGGNAAIRERGSARVFLAHAARRAVDRGAASRSCGSATAGTRRTDLATRRRCSLARGSDGCQTHPWTTARGGERIRLGRELVVEVLHLPGHSPGHVGLWDPASRTAIVMDAVMGRGLLDMEGNVISPPPYFDVTGYPSAPRTLSGASTGAAADRALRRDRGAEVERFLDGHASPSSSAPGPHRRSGGRGSEQRPGRAPRAG